jgi:hypothetical protein
MKSHIEERALTYIYLDIETIPTQSEAVRAEIAASITPPGSMKKAETIAAWEQNDKPQAVADAIAKTSFDPAYGHICTISWAIGDEPAGVAHARDVSEEADLLRAFFACIPADTWAKPCFVGHYISGFDLRFILCRAVILGVPIPPSIPRDPKPWGNDVFDTMTAWAGAKGTISMDRLSRAMGLPGKGDFDGSMVADAWARGDHETIINYCADDVERTREIHRRFTAVNW